MRFDTSPKHIKRTEKIVATMRLLTYVTANVVRAGMMKLLPVEYVRRNLYQNVNTTETQPSPPW